MFVVVVLTGWISSSPVALLDVPIIQCILAKIRSISVRVYSEEIFIPTHSWNLDFLHWTSCIKLT